MKKYGFIGAGKMASAMVRGMLGAGSAKPDEICCISGDDGTGEALAKVAGIALSASLESLCAECEVLVLACKPQQLADISIPEGGAKPRLVISILAGTSIARLREKFTGVPQIVRAMPNMPAQISQGISCYASESPLNVDDARSVQGVLGAIGDCCEVEESQLDAVTALSGSGPGYVFEFAAALIAAGVGLGFSEDMAKRLALKTLSGSAALLERSELSAEELRNAVSSPGGTTLAALEVFKNSNFRKTVSDALNAACKRSQELSKL